MKRLKSDSIAGQAAALGFKAEQMALERLGDGGRCLYISFAADSVEEVFYKLQVGAGVEWL